MVAEKEPTVGRGRDVRIVRCVVGVSDDVILIFMIFVTCNFMSLLISRGECRYLGLIFVCVCVQNSFLPRKMPSALSSGVFVRSRKILKCFVIEILDNKSIQSNLAHLTLSIISY